VALQPSVMSSIPSDRLEEWTVIGDKAEQQNGGKVGLGVVADSLLSVSSCSCTK
jgi:hypothetical protein